MVEQLDKNISALALFMQRWEDENKKLNEGLPFPIYELHLGNLFKLAEDFTKEEKQFIQSKLDEARPTIGHVNIMK